MKIIEIPEVLEFPVINDKGNTRNLKLPFPDFLQQAIKGCGLFKKGDENIQMAGKLRRKIEGINGDAELRLEDAQQEALWKAVDTCEWNEVVSPYLDVYFNAVKEAKEVGE